MMGKVQANDGQSKLSVKTKENNNYGKKDNNIWGDYVASGNT